MSSRRQHGRVQAYSGLWTGHVHNTSWPADCHPGYDVGYPCYGKYLRGQHGRVQAYSVVWTGHVHNISWPADCHQGCNVG